MVSTHQTELVLGRPCVCQQLCPGSSFLKYLSGGAKVEKAIIIGHLGMRETRKPEDLGQFYFSDAQELIRRGLKAFSEPIEDLQKSSR